MRSLRTGDRLSSKKGANKSFDYGLKEDKLMNLPAADPSVSRTWINRYTNMCMHTDPCIIRYAYVRIHTTIFGKIFILSNIGCTITIFHLGRTIFVLSYHVKPVVRANVRVLRIFLIYGFNRRYVFKFVVAKLRFSLWNVPATVSFARC